MTATLTKLDLSSLTDDGDALDLPDGRTLRLKIEVDQDTGIGDFPDFYGRLTEERVRRNDYGYEARPSDMTGNAEKLWYGNDGPWWWEPPVDIKRSNPMFRELRDNVRELLAFGFTIVILELLQGEDAYRRPIVVATASLGGIDFTSRSDYIHEVVSELADELGVS
jgi:hypothetical protein